MMLLWVGCALMKGKGEMDRIEGHRDGLADLYMSDHKAREAG